MGPENSGVFRKDFPDRPADLGACLKRLREENGVELDQIFQETKVSIHVFEALESGAYQRLPQKVFCRNFLRQYARIIGGPEDELLEAFDRAWERFQLASGTHPSLIVEESPRRVFRWWVWAPPALALIVLCVLAMMMIRSCSRENELQRDPRRSLAAVSPSPTARRLPPTPEAAQSVPSPIPEAQEQTTLAFSVSVLPGRECWIRYRDHSGAMGQDLLRAGQRRDFELLGPVLLTLGNADAAVITIGAESYGELGSPGQVIHLEIGPTGLKKFGPMEVAGG